MLVEERLGVGGVSGGKLLMVFDLLNYHQPIVSGLSFNPLDPSSATCYFSWRPLHIYRRGGGE